MGGHSPVAQLRLTGRLRERDGNGFARSAGGRVPPDRSSRCGRGPIGPQYRTLRSDRAISCGEITDIVAIGVIGTLGSAPADRQSRYRALIGTGSAPPVAPVAMRTSWRIGRERTPGGPDSFRSRGRRRAQIAETFSNICASTQLNGPDGPGRRPPATGGEAMMRARIGRAGSSARYRLTEPTPELSPGARQMETTRSTRDPRSAGTSRRATTRRLGDAPSS